MSTEHETVIQNIRRVADEIRVRIHLAGMEAKDAWAGLEPRVAQLEKTIDRVTTEASADMTDLATTVQTELRRLRDKLFEGEEKSTKS
jgi:hypothetical protein